jgi:hypothetical protein
MRGRWEALDKLPGDSVYIAQLFPPRQAYSTDLLNISARFRLKAKTLPAWLAQLPLIPSTGSHLRENSEPDQPKSCSDVSTARSDTGRDGR